MSVDNQGLTRGWRRFFKKYVVGDHERGLLFERKRFSKVMGPGVYRFIDLKNEFHADIYSLSDPEVPHPELRVLYEQFRPLFQPFMDRVRTGQWEVALLYDEEVLADIVPPLAERFYWRVPRPLRVEHLDISERADLPVAGVAAISALARGRLRNRLGQFIVASDVPTSFVGLLRVNGEHVRVLPPGSHAFWAFNRNVSITTVDLREQSIDVSGQEILTKDKVSLRLNVAVVFRIVDVEKLIESIPDHKELLYRETQFALREAVGTKTLDELLADKEELNRAVFTYVAERAALHGLKIMSAGVKDVILPGEMKTILNQVVEAEKAAQANNIRRREETAATRSLLNTAKLMEGNPLLLHLKELEVLERVTEKVEKLTVFGGLEGVLRSVVGRKASGEH